MAAHSLLSLGLWVFGSGFMWTGLLEPDFICHFQHQQVFPLTP